MADGRETFKLYVLPGGQDAVSAVGQRGLDAAIGELREWLRAQGYAPLGPAFLAWDAWAERQVRQPIAPVFAPSSSPLCQVVERPEQMVVDVTIAVKAGKYNLAGVYDHVRDGGFDPLGAPYVPFLAEPPATAARARGFVPVAPRGTESLIPLPGWLSAKIGWPTPTPQLGRPLPRRAAFEDAGRMIARSLIALILLSIVLLSTLGAAGWVFIAGERSMVPQFVLSSFEIMVGAGTLGTLAWGGLLARRRLRAIRRWNAFWTETPFPPLLIVDFEVEE